ncbi:MAG: fasciclin domain-containing protein [Alphaproteobacteria bacterium]|nr:fasciclin domain-containing protein [Alphaproteobacteria bacterium]
MRLLHTLALSAAVAVMPLMLVSVHAGSMTQSEAAVPAGDIVDIAASNENFSTLVAAIKAADLVDTLKGAGPFTVFAPTNEAFAKLPAGTLEMLLKPENKDQLVAILTYHVVAGKVMSADLSGKAAEVATVEGSSLAVDGTMGVKVNAAMVVTADVGATNGVIHIIDTVLLPPAKTGATQ